MGTALRFMGFSLRDAVSSSPSVLEFLLQPADLAEHIFAASRPGRFAEFLDRGLGLGPVLAVDLRLARSTRPVGSRGRRLATCSHCCAASSQSFCSWRISASAWWLAASAGATATMEV